MLSPGKENRRHERHPLPGKVRLNWKTSEGFSFSATARCLDISQSGIRLELERQIATGTLVNLESPDFRIAGVAAVRHCRPKGLRFILGLEFSGGLTFRQRPPAS